MKILKCFFLTAFFRPVTVTLVSYQWYIQASLTKFACTWNFVRLFYAAKMSIDKLTVKLFTTNIFITGAWILSVDSIVPLIWFVKVKPQWN